MSNAFLHGVLLPVSKLLSLLRLWPPIPSIGRYAGAAQAYTPSESDVFVCSYMKSGTTWLLQIVTQIAFRGRAEFENIHHVVPWIETPGLLRKTTIPLSDMSPAQLSPTGLRAIKTHLPFHMVPYSSSARYIALIRDPKAVAVSSYHFIKAMSLGPTMPEFPKWLDHLLSPSFPQGSWAAHVVSFWKRRDDPNLLILTYEDLREDLGKAVDRIAAFLKVELLEEERRAVISQSGFSYMKQHAIMFDAGRLFPWSEDGAMIRAGGNGKDEPLLTPELAMRIDRSFGEQLRDLGSDFDYQSFFGGGGDAAALSQECRRAC